MIDYVMVRSETGEKTIIRKSGERELFMVKGLDND